MTNERRQALGLCLAARAEKDGKPRFAPCHEPIDERVERAVFAPRAAGQGDGALEVRLIASHQRRRVLGGKLEAGEVTLRGSAGDGRAVKREHGAPPHRSHDGRFFVVELGFGQMGRPALLGGVRRGAPQLVADGARQSRWILEHDHGVVGDVVKERLELVIRRQKTLRAEESAAAGHVLDQGARAAGGQIHRVAQRAHELARAIGRFRREDRLARRREPHLLELAERALQRRDRRLAAR